MRKHLSGIAAVSSLLLVGACGSGDGANGSGGEEGDLIPLTVSAIPISNTAPLWLGIEKGFFEEEGLDVSIEQAEGGADIPGVISGNFDFAFGNLVSVFVAKEQGLDLRFVSNAVSANSEAEADTSGVIVRGDSDIMSPADLAGKTVSVNTLSNIGDTTVRRVVEEDGGDQSTIDFVEVDFPNTAAAVENGQVDAAWTTEPFLTIAQKAGARVISYNWKETHPDLDAAGYFTSGDMVENNPETVEKFQAAMARSLEYAQENEDETRAIIGTYTEMDEALIGEITLPEFRPEFNREATELLGQLAAEYGTLSDEPNLDELLP